jgi:thiosulfate reductase cytochrome b subunit
LRYEIVAIGIKSKLFVLSLLRSELEKCERRDATEKCKETLAARTEIYSSFSARDWQMSALKALLFANLILLWFMIKG